ncbi:baseplate complex protein [Marinomonas sp.]|uniref:baseplate complex protein n=1 Tax=Marinomonas sp. TaxID=1904862 RepID=UPI003F994E56
MILLVLNDTQIDGYGHKVSCSFSLPESDLSGKSSSTATSEEGEKACQLRVSLNIKYEDSSYLKTIKQLSTAKDDEGKRVVYNINNQTAAAFGVRQVRFTDKVSANEMDDTHAWSVSFTLIEHLSIPEKIEEQKIKKDEPAAAPADEKVVSEESSESTKATGWFEKLVASLDTALADEGAASDEV